MDLLLNKIQQCKKLHVILNIRSDTAHQIIVINTKNRKAEKYGLNLDIELFSLMYIK